MHEWAFIVKEKFKEINLIMFKWIYKVYNYVKRNYSLSLQ